MFNLISQKQQMSIVSDLKEGLAQRVWTQIRMGVPRRAMTRGTMEFRGG